METTGSTRMWPRADRLLRELGSIPSRFWVLAAGLASLLLFFGSITPMSYGVFGNGIEAVSLYQRVGELGVLLTALAPLVALRWTWTALATSAAVPVVLVVLGDNHQWSFVSFAGLLGVAACGAWWAPRTSWVASAVAVCFPLALALAGTTVVAPDGAQSQVASRPGGNSLPIELTTLALYLFVVVSVTGAAHGLRSSARRAADRAALDGERRAVSNDAALLGERSRLARDLHDVVAHHVFLIAVRAETAPYTVPDIGPGARLVLADIAEDSRKALDELRGVLGVLRRADGDSRRSPQPGAGDIGELVASAAEAGEVTLTGAEHLAALPPATGYVAYRLVQEALTNARRHAPRAPVRVEVAATGGGIRFRVANRAVGSGPVTPGRGLTGMAERVAAVGGELDTEVRGGDFVVEAHLPAGPAAARA